jgi:hypothetical protein
MVAILGPLHRSFSLFGDPENLVSDCFSIDEWKTFAKAARSTRRLRLKFSTVRFGVFRLIGL